MFRFFIRKDVRKILKRKDSDAGERGRALEELRASMFNKLRLVTGPKRQMQSLWGPTVALTFNFLVSVTIILMNKLVLVNVGFNYPIFLTFIHYVCSWFIMALLKALSILSLSSPPKSTKYSSLFSLGIVMSLSTGLANVSLKYNR
ncbi:nucleotide/sugar transporter family protein [Striga asiatica]|uniref:Nucleotide/sugar transporter family protein n=1 Tax=Striga asiatica TaxID=4170 RepID=A0A5A7R2X9_STRAF|nr:nucleotide/sugar transporter family protein [Striga asiatica]